MLQLTHKHIEIIRQLPSTANVQVNSNSILIEFPEKPLFKDGEFSQAYFLTWLKMNGFSPEAKGNIVTIILHYPGFDNA